MNTCSNAPRVLGIEPPTEPVDQRAYWRWWLETAVVGFLGLGAILGPVALGGVPSLALTGLDLIVACATIGWIVSAPRSGWLAWMPVTAATIAAVQLVPVPMPMLAWLSPGSAEAWKGIGDGTWFDMRTISVDPGATADAMRHLFLGVCAIAVVADLCRDRRRREVLAGFIAIAGVTVWSLAFLFPMNDEHVLLGRFDLRGPEKNIAWCTTAVPPIRTSGIVGCCVSPRVEAGESVYSVQRWVIGDGIGSYVYSNHFAAGMYLTIPLLVGLCRTRWRGPLWGWGGAALAVLLLAAGIWTVGAQAHSRAGAGSMALGGIVFMFLSSESRGARMAWSVVLIAAIAVLVAFAMVFFQLAPGLTDLLPGDLGERLLAVLQREGRRSLTHDAVRIFMSSPVFGTGLGSYGFLQPHVSGILPGTFYTAFYTHNDYAQLLAEAGLFGCAALFALGIALVFCVVSVPRLPFRERMLAAGVCSALAAIALHSFYDWNLHVPANRLLACLVVGLAMATVPLVPSLRAIDDGKASSRSAASDDETDSGPTVSWSPRRALAVVILAGICLATMYLAVRDHTTEYYRARLRMALVKVRTATTEEQRTQAVGRLQWYVTRARSWSRHHPTDSELPLLAGQAVLHLDAVGEGLEGEEADAWFERARNRNPLRIGFPEERGAADGAPAESR